MSKFVDCDAAGSEDGDAEGLVDGVVALGLGRQNRCVELTAAHHNDVFIVQACRQVGGVVAWPSATRASRLLLRTESARPPNRPLGHGAALLLLGRDRSGRACTRSIALRLTPYGSGATYLTRSIDFARVSAT